MERKLAAPKQAERLAEIFKKNGYDLFIVGGWVRNALLSLPHIDIDVCSEALPTDVCSFLSKEEGIESFVKCERLGTLEIKIFNGEHVFLCEYSAFRHESYGEGGHHAPENVWFTKELDKDAFRRDFSVNALYLDIISGEIKDPTMGLPDLAGSMLRTTSQDAEWIIKDDGLRILRMVRLACELGFLIQPGLYRTAKRLIHLLKDISKERIKEELVRILLADTRYPSRIPRFDLPAHARGIFMLKDLGALEYILPELLEGQGVIQRQDFHAYDVLTHSILACALSPPRLALRIAALLHDVGKPQALKKSGNMYGHDIISTEIARKALGHDGLRFDNKTLSEVCELIQLHMFDLDNRAKDSTVRKKFAKVGERMARNLILLREADVAGSGKTSTMPPEIKKWEAILSDMRQRKTPVHETELALSGKDIMKLIGEGPSPKIGKIKKAMFEYVVLNPEKNTKAALEGFVGRYVKRS